MCEECVLCMCVNGSVWGCGLRLCHVCVCVCVVCCVLCVCVCVCMCVESGDWKENHNANPYQGAINHDLSGVDQLMSRGNTGVLVWPVLREKHVVGFGVWVFVCLCVREFYCDALRQILSSLVWGGFSEIIYKKALLKG